MGKLSLSGPAGAVPADIDVDKLLSRVVADTAVVADEGVGHLVEALGGNARDRDVGGQAVDMGAVGYAPDGPVIGRGTVGRVNREGLPPQSLANLFQLLHQLGSNPKVAIAGVVAEKLAGPKVVG